MATQRARKAKTSPASSASSMLSLGRPAASLDPPSRRSTSRETVTTGHREVGGTAAFVDMTDGIRSEQQRDMMLHAQEHAAKVDPHDAVPLTFGDIGRRHDLLFHARIAESEVETPECLDSLIQRYLHISGSRHVAPNCDRAAASLFNHACRGPAFRAAIVGSLSSIGHLQSSFSGVTGNSRTRLPVA